MIKKSQDIIKNFIEDFDALKDLNKTNEPIIKNLIDKHKTNFKGVGQPLRIGLVGTKFGPGIYDIILSLDKTTVINRLKISLMSKLYLFSQVNLRLDIRLQKMLLRSKSKRYKNKFQFSDYIFKE